MSAQHSHDHATPAPCCGAAPATPTDPVVAPGAGEQVSRIHIEQMDCPTEERLIRQRLTGMAGVGTLHFNLLQRVLSVSHLPERREAVLTAINELGFSPRLLVDDHRPEASASKPWWPLALAGGVALLAEIVHFTSGPVWLGALLALLAIALSGIDTYRKGCLPSFVSA